MRIPANYVNRTCEMPHKSRKNSDLLRSSTLTSTHRAGPRP